MITVKSIHIRGQFYIKHGTIATATNFPDGMRAVIAIVHDKQTNQAVIDPDDVYQGVNSIAAPYLMDEWRNMQYTSRFKVLAYKEVCFDQIVPEWDSTAGNFRVAGQVRPFEINLKKLDMPVQFSGTSGVIGSVTNNSIQVIACANYKDGGVGEVKMQYKARCRFYG
jgi:aryl carrier-like protein